MKQILVYSDSLSWGIIPATRNRLEFKQRWPGIFEAALNAQGYEVRVIEDCLNGRRTVWEDPFKAGRNGLVGLAQRIEVSSPLALVVLMLGTNDFSPCTITTLGTPRRELQRWYLLFAKHPLNQECRYHKFW